MSLVAPPDALAVRDITTTRPLGEVLADDGLVRSMASDLLAGDAFVVPGALAVDRAEQLRTWLAGIGRSSLPTWHPIAEGAPNHHRVMDDDERAHVAGCFHQFSFFPWNQDPLRLFETLAPVYALKNRLHGLEPEAFCGRRPEKGCTARASVQMYPRGGGALNEHADPVGYHQSTVPSILLSAKGRDFETGGLFVVDTTGARVDVDAVTGVGDALFFNARARHGVEPIDPEAPRDWLAFEGRWALVAAVNRVADNERIADSKDLGGG